MQTWPADKITKRNIDELIPYARNSRTHSDEQVAQIAASIKEWGWTTPVLIDEDGGLIAGHGRVMAARQLGITEIPTMTARGWTEAQKKAYILADNQLPQNAGWDMDMLKVEMMDLNSEGFNLDLIGFSEDMVTNLLNDPAEGLTDPDDVPELTDDPVTKPGDVWLLGKHRLMCGDSTSIDAVDKLMDGDKADMVFTDPPYNLGSENKLVAASASKAMEDLKNADWDKGFDLGDVFPTMFAVMANDVTVYLCSSHHLIAKFWEWAAEWSSHYNWIVWSKPDPMPSLTKRHWTWDAELIGYATRGKHIFNTIEGKHSPSTWRINKQQGGEKTGHPTQKPVAVPQHAIEHSSRNNQIVLDLFGGSGSTLIACERTGRKNRSMELDPKYCDVIVQRWCAFTGQEATLEGSGEKFPIIKADAA